MTPFESLAKTSLLLRATRDRSEKAERLPAFLRTLEPGEIGAAVGLLSGSTRFGKVGIGYTTLGRVEAGPAEIGAQPPSIQDVERELEGLAERTPKALVSLALRARKLPDESWIFTTVRNSSGC